MSYIHTFFLCAGGEHCFDYDLPTCVIPDSSKATISVTGERESC